MIESPLKPETKVVNIKTEPHWKQDPNFVYIGRGGPFGNKFIIGLHGDRETVIKLYRESLTFEDKRLIRERCTGKILGCYCKPKACHGDVIKEVCDGSLENRDEEGKSEKFDEKEAREDQPESRIK